MSSLNLLGTLLIKFFSVLLVVLLPIKSIMLAVFCLVLADFVTGVWASIKEGRRITSHGFKKSISKLIAYEAAIIMSFVIESYLFSGFPLIKIASGLIALTEGKSFFENINRITGVDFTAEFIKRFREYNSDRKYSEKPEDKN